MKKKVLFMCLISAIGISGCGKQTTTNPVPSQSVTSTKAKEMSEEDKNFEAHFNEITVEGNTISFPCSYQEMTNAGFKFSYSRVHYAVHHSATGTSWTWKDNEENFFDIGFGFIGEDLSKPLEECDALSFYWLPEVEGNADIIFYGGINADSSREDVARILDEVYADESKAKYWKYLDRLHHKGMCVTFLGDQMNDIEMDNSADYID